MRNKCLLIFIDSLPYDLLNKLDLKVPFDKAFKVIPGLGYSINIHAELFAGLKPDQVGFFNTCTYEPAQAKITNIKKAINHLHWLDHNYYTAGITRKLMRWTGGNIANIPFRFLNKFKTTGEHIFSPRFPAKSIFSEPENFDCLLSEYQNENESDNKRYKISLESIGKSSRLFVSFCELDHISHKFGVSSKEYLQELTILKNYIETLYKNFRRIFSDGHIIIMSDHGMANVREGVVIDIESELGPAGDKTYFYFIDSTILRVWTFNQILKEKIEISLNSKKSGRVLSEKDRSDLGISSSKWGDIIYLLNEGFIFAPSFLEKGIPKAMHGYHPDLPSQKGIFMYSGSLVVDKKESLSSVDVFRLLKEICGFRL